MPINNYCTSDEIKAAMPDVFDSVTSYDTFLGVLASRASRAVDKWTGRSPGAYYVNADQTFYLDGPSKPSNLGYANDNRLGGGFNSSNSLWIPEMAAAPTSVAMALSGDQSNYTLLASTDYLMYPYNALAEGIPYNRIDLDTLYGTYKFWYSFRKCIKIVGKFGYSATVPDDIKQATIIQAARWLKRGQQGFQDSSAMGDLGSLRYVKQIDPDVEMMLMNYRKVTI